MNGFSECLYIRNCFHEAGLNSEQFEFSHFHFCLHDGGFEVITLVMIRHYSWPLSYFKIVSMVFQCMTSIILDGFDTNLVYKSTY